MIGFKKYQRLIVNTEGPRPIRGIQGSLFGGQKRRVGPNIE